jgi:hypothetical protein
MATTITATTTTITSHEEVRGRTRPPYFFVILKQRAEYKLVPVCGSTLQRMDSSTSSTSCGQPNL